MTHLKTSRGRPKGTGLNDAAQLQAIAGLLAAQPELKPTTAIKKLGIHDPSVIRRLRDKYNAIEAELSSDMKAGAITALATLQASAARSVPLKGTRELKKSAAVPPVAVEAKAPARVVEITPAVEPIPAPVVAQAVVIAVAPVEEALPKRRAPAFVPPSETELPKWMGVGLSLFVFSFEAQYAVVGTLMQWSPLREALKTQAKFVEFSVAAANPSRLAFPSG